MGIFSCALPSIPQAQSASLTNPAEISAQEQLRQQERERVQRQQLEVRPDVRLSTPITSTIDAQEGEDNEILPPDETPCFNIRSISLIGEASERFQWLLNHVDHTATGTEDVAIGRCLGIHGFNVVLHRLQAALTQQGWVDTSNSCLSGMCTSKEKSLNNILWNPVNLENTNCPDISGKYKGNENLIAQFDFRNSPFGKKSTTYENHNEIPFISSIKIKNVLPGQKISPDNNTYLYSDSAEFYENSHINIEQLDNSLTISLKDSKNVLYRRYGISLTPPDIGCNKNYLVIRLANAVGSAEGALGSAFATEKKFRKLPNGSLEIHITTREWYYNSSVGLIGIGTDGHASGIEPRHVDKVLIFSPIK